MIVIDMDMPKDCGKCKLLMQCKGYCYIENKLPNTCPIKCDIEQIRDEIEEGLTDYIIGEWDTSTAKKMFNVMDKALEIIDKHISGKEKE